MVCATGAVSIGLSDVLQAVALGEPEGWYKMQVPDMMLN